MHPKPESNTHGHLGDVFARFEAMGPSGSRMPRTDPRHGGLPDAMALGRWRARANLRLEDELARFDARLLCGDAAVDAARDTSVS